MPISSKVLKFWSLTLKLDSLWLSIVTRAAWLPYAVQFALVILPMISPPAMSQDQQLINGKVLDARGKPVLDAQVIFIRKDGFYKNEFDLTYAEVKCASDGTFSVKDSGVVELRILARRPASRFVEFVEVGPFRPEPGHTLNLEIRLPQNRASIAGRVADDAGNPVIGATVAACPPVGHCLTTPHLMRWDDRHATNNFLYSAQKYLPMAVTDEGGNFLIEGIPGGRYTLIAGAPEYLLSRLPGIEVKPGLKLHGFQVSLKPESGSGDLHISGRITDGRGRPADHISVQALDRKGNPIRSTFSNEGGYYKLAVPQAGLYTVAVRAMDQELARRESMRTGSAGVNFQLPLMEITGRVTLPAGRPLTGEAVVEAVSINWSITRQVKTSGRGQSGGTFVIGQLPPGPVTVSAGAAGYREDVKTVTLSPDRQARVELELVPECQVSVRVLESTSGRPLLGVPINIVEAIDNTPRWRLAGYTDSEGLLVDRQCRPGKTTVVAINPNHSRDNSEVNLSPGRPAEVALRLKRNCTITGSVTDGKGRVVPASRITVEAVPVVPMFLFFDLRQVEGTYPASYAEGRYTIHLPAGRYKVRVMAEVPGPVYQEATRRPVLLETQSYPMMASSGEIDVRWGQDYRVDLVLKR